MPFFSRRPKHNPDEVALVMDITGLCNHCHHRGQARLTAYYSGEVVMRCFNCRTANEFTPDDATYNDPTKFLPFRDDDDPGEEPPKKYSKGRR